MLGATKRLAAAEVISADAAVAAVFQTWMVFLHWKSQKKQHRRLFLSGDMLYSQVALAEVRFNTVAYCGSPWDADTWLKPI